MTRIHEEIPHPRLQMLSCTGPLTRNTSKMPLSPSKMPKNTTRLLIDRGYSSRRRRASSQSSTEGRPNRWDQPSPSPSFRNACLCVGRGCSKDRVATTAPPWRRGRVDVSLRVAVAKAGTVRSSTVICADLSMLSTVVRPCKMFRSLESNFEKVHQAFEFFAVHLMMRSTASWSRPPSARIRSTRLTRA